MSYHLHVYYHLPLISTSHEISVFKQYYIREVFVIVVMWLACFVSSLWQWELVNTNPMWSCLKLVLGKVGQVGWKIEKDLSAKQIRVTEFSSWNTLIYVRYWPYLLNPISCWELLFVYPSYSYYFELCLGFTIEKCTTSETHSQFCDEAKAWTVFSNDV